MFGYRVNEIRLASQSRFASVIRCRNMKKTAFLKRMMAEEKWFVFNNVKRNDHRNTANNINKFLKFSMWWDWLDVVIYEILPTHWIFKFRMYSD